MTKTATVTLHKQAILAEIDALTYKRADGVLSKESEQLKNALSSDSSEDLDKHILYRCMDTRDANLRGRLAFCLRDTDIDSMSVSNILDTDTKYEFALNVPEKFTGERLKALARKMHEYIMHGTLCDWYATQNMKGNVSETDLEAMETEIVCMLRSSYVKRPLQPFGPK